MPHYLIKRREDFPGLGEGSSSRTYGPVEATSPEAAVLEAGANPEPTATGGKVDIKVYAVQSGPYGEEALTYDKEDLRL